MIPLLFDTVKLIPWDDRPEHWLRDGVPVARVLVLPGPWGTAGGILRIHHTIWLTLSAAQLFQGAEIPWPGDTGDLRGIVLDGTSVRPVLRHG